MYTTENYYFDNGGKATRVWDSASKTTIVVPVILAIDSYIEMVRQGMLKKEG